LILLALQVWLARQDSNVRHPICGPTVDIVLGEANAGRPVSPSVAALLSYAAEN
jgi:hypothetical protein